MTSPTEAPRTAVRRLLDFLDYELPYWGDMAGQEHRWEVYTDLLSAARAEAAAPAAAPAPLDVPKHRPAIGLSSAGRHTLCMADGEPWPCRTVAATPPTDEIQEEA